MRTLTAGYSAEAAVLLIACAAGGDRAARGEPAPALLVLGIGIAGINRGLEATCCLLQQELATQAAEERARRYKRITTRHTKQVRPQAARLFCLVVLRSRARA